MQTQFYYESCRFFGDSRMIIFRYPSDKFKPEDIMPLIQRFSELTKIPTTKIMAIPKNVSLIKADRKTLIDLRNAIDKCIHSMTYEKKCQADEDEKPCVDEETPDCNKCDYYYSDDDDKW